MSFVIRPFKLITSPKPCMASWVRHAGGGGRPGTRPAFSWKEKVQLGLNDKKKLKPLKNSPFGFMDELMPHFNPEKGDKMIEITETTEYKDDLEALLRDQLYPIDTEECDRKVVQSRLLFGSSKSTGFAADYIKRGGKRANPEDRPVKIHWKEARKQKLAAREANQSL